MPANEMEIVAAEEEGVKFHFLAAPSRVIAGEDGKAEKLEYIKMELGEPDASGRRRPVPIEGSETTLDIDTVIAAIGQKADMSATIPIYASTSTKNAKLPWRSGQSAKAGSLNMKVVKIEPQNGGACHVSLKLSHDQSLLDSGRLSFDDMVTMRSISATGQDGRIVKGRIVSIAVG